MSMSDAISRLYQSRLDEHVRPEIQALVKRGHITLDEYKNLRCNSWEWDHVHGALDDEALVYAVEHNLKNCFPKSHPCTTYSDSLAAIFAPELLRRFKANRDAYAKGRREAIEEAVRFFRAATAEQVRALAEFHEIPIEACASAIVKHEASRG